MKQKKKVIIITLIVVILGVIGTVIWGIKSGRFLSPKYKVLQATVRTLEESEMMNHMDISEWIGEGEKRLQGEIELDGVGEAEVQALLQEEELKIQIPTFGDFVFIYPYQEEKTGFLVEKIGNEKLERVDEILRFLYMPPETMQLEENDWSELKEEWKSWKFEGCEGAERETEEGTECEAYTTTISVKQLENISFLQELIKGDSFDFSKKIEESEEVHLIFYLAKQKVMAVQVLQQEKVLWDIAFVDSEEKETIIISENDEVLYEISYEKKSGKLKLQTGNYKEDGKKNRFRIQMDGESVTIDLRDTEMMEWKLSGTFNLTKNQEGETLEGAEIRLGGMEKEDWEALVEEIKETLWKKILFFL